jgi:hypothetical protein
MEGGTLVADYLCGVLDERGKGREKGVLDDLFGIIRNESAGYMDGTGLSEIDGEKYQKSFLNRFSNYKGAYRYKDIIVFERGTKHQPGCKGVGIKKFMSKFYQASILIENEHGKGKTFYLNLSPLEYWDPSKRFSGYGQELRNIVSNIMNGAELHPRVKIFEKGTTVNMIEALYWKEGNKRYLGLVKNPTEQKELRTVGRKFDVQGITGDEVEIRLEFKEPIRELDNLRTNRRYGPGQVFQDNFKPWEGNLYEVIH